MKRVGRDWDVLLAFWFLFCCVATFMMATSATMAATSHADPMDKVVVDRAVENSAALKARFERKLTPDDDVAVFVAPGDDHDQLGDYLTNLYKGNVLILAIGSDVWVRGNDWVPQVAMDDILQRVMNVNRGVGDQVVGIIVETHRYQAGHAKPAPPPPPPAPPAPPEPPFDWSPYMTYIYFGVPILILFLIWLPLHLRYRRRIKRLSHDADTQADWGFDQYGIKSGSDL